MIRCSAGQCTRRNTRSSRHAAASLFHRGSDSSLSFSLLFESQGSLGAVLLLRAFDPRGRLGCSPRAGRGWSKISGVHPRFRILFCGKQRDKRDTLHCCRKAVVLHYQIKVGVPFDRTVIRIQLVKNKTGTTALPPPWQRTRQLRATAPMA